MKIYIRILSFTICIFLFGMFAVSCTKPTDEESRDSEEAIQSNLSVLLSQFSLIYDDASEEATAAAVWLYHEMKDSGHVLNLFKDSEHAQTADAKEILIGKTDRAHSGIALAELRDVQAYEISFAQNSVAIVADHDAALSAAVQYFYDTYVASAKDGVLNATQGTVEIGYDHSLVVPVKEGKAIYGIVVARSASAELGALAKQVQQRLKTVTGVELAIVNDEQSSEDGHWIAIGKTKLNSSASVLAQIAENEYTVQTYDRHLIVMGHTDQTTSLAVEMLLQDVLKGVKVTDGTLCFALEEALTESFSISLSEIPSFEAGSFLGTYPCGDGVTQDLYRNADHKGMNAYVRELNAGGFITVEDRTVEKNRFVSCLGSSGMVHLTYLNYNKTLSVVSDPMTDRVYKDEEPRYTKVTDPSVALMTIDYDVQDPNHGNGLLMIVTLEDGRYIVIDGGYANSGDDDAIYNYMKTNNQRSDGKILIAAWIFTHADGDHVGAFQTFSKNYASKVTVEYFIFNTSTTEMYTEGKHAPFLERDFEGYRKQYYADSKVIKPHTGQRLTFCNTEIEILYTHEVFAPELMEWENYATIIFRMTMGEKNFLMMGDSEIPSTDILCQMYGEYLKSDMMQVPHHGYSGGTTELYDLADVTYLFWSCQNEIFEKRTSGVGNSTTASDQIAVNKYVYDRYGITYCFIADDQSEVLTVKDGKIVISATNSDFKKH